MIDQITAILHKELDWPARPSKLPEVITMDSSLAADLHMTDVDRACVLVAVDEAFGLLIGDAEFDGWACVGDIVRSVESRRVVA